MMMNSLAKPTLERQPQLIVQVNDQPRAVPPGATVASLLGELGLAERKGVAVAINGEVVGRANWASQTLAAEDRVLVIQATQGG
jgi:sulfur carrier protein